MTDSSDVSTLIAQIELARTRRLDPAHPDTEAIRSTSLKALDPTLLRDYLTSCRSRSRRLAALDDTEVLRAAGVIAPSGEVTLAGIYAMGKNPQRHRPSLGITAAVLMPVGAKERTRDLIHLTGPIPDLLDGAMPWIARNTPTSIRYDDLGNSREVPVLPMWAVREILVNALVHRNLDAATEAERIELRMVGSTLVITSPGGLRGITEDALGQPDSKCAVNPVLYEICKNLHTTDGARLITDESGIHEVRDAVARADLPEPILRNSGFRFTTILRWPATETAEDADEAPAPHRSPGTIEEGTMQRDLLKRDLVQLDWEVADQDEFFNRMSDRLLGLGYVEESFPAAVKARERAYPTALPTQPEAIAIPHSDAEHIIEPFIASTRLASPVTWHEMANNDETHAVRFIFMLGFTKEDGHVEVLQILLENFQDPGFMQRLDRARTEDEYVAALATMSGLDA